MNKEPFFDYIHQWKDKVVPTKCVFLVFISVFVNSCKKLFEHAQHISARFSDISATA